jgi:hypothetical protein
MSSSPKGVFVSERYLFMGRQFIGITTFYLSLIFICCAFVYVPHCVAKVQSRYLQKQFTTDDKPISLPLTPRGFLQRTHGNSGTVANWREILSYFSHLDEMSDAVSIQAIGESTEKRPMIAVIVSDPENIQNLTKYEEIQRVLSDPRKVNNEEERDGLVTQGKIVVAVLCSTNVTDVAGAQMSMQLAYSLATAKAPNTKSILRDTILILIPSVNPDGLNATIEQNKKKSSIGVEKTSQISPFPNPRSGIDKDWLTLNLKENKLISAFLWRKWHPQIVFDFQQTENATGKVEISHPYNPQPTNLLSVMDDKCKNIIEVISSLFGKTNVTVATK